MKETKGKKSKNLTNRQKKFIEGVVQHDNATKAAKQAGYSPKTARVIAAQNLTKLNILEAVAKRRAEALKRAGITTDEIVGSIAEIATSSLADVNPDDVFLKKAKASGVDHLIKKVKVNYDRKGKVTSREYEMYSRLDALDKLLDVRGARKQAAANPKDVAKQALADMRARFPDLSEETAKQIVSETFNVQISELVN
jgi:phage terminase small subunit